MRTSIQISLIAIFLCCFIPDPATARDLEEIKRSGFIRIAFTNTDYNTINYPLALEFAKYLNVELEEVTITWEEAFRINGKIPEYVTTNPGVAYTPDIFREVDAIFSTFTILEWRKKLFDFSETLLSAELIIISGQDESPKSLEDLAGKTIAMMKGTSFETRIAEINDYIGGGITSLLTEDSDGAKQLLADGQAWGVILDADEALNFMVRHDGQFQIGIPINPISKTAYAVEKGNPLRKEIESFFETITNNGVLDRIFSEMFNLSYSEYTGQISRNFQLEPLKRDLDEILLSKKIVVALRDRNFVYREGGQKQFMHALAEEFADYLGVQMEFVVTPYFARYWETEQEEIFKDSSYTPEWFNYFDIACEIMAPDDWRTNKVDLVGIYPSEYSVIGKKETKITGIKDMRDLYGITGRGTIYEQILQNNGIDSFYYAPVNDFLSDVESGKADYTMIYNAFFELSDYPGLEVKLPMGEVEVCWALRKDQPDLKAELEEFLDRSRQKGLTNILLKAIKGQSLQNTDDFISSYYESLQTGHLPYVLYGAEDGLPQEDVFAIFQDHQGYMWFGTNSGVARYNGREMKAFNTGNGLTSNTVLDIAQDSSGLIYFATSNGISVFDEDTLSLSYLPGVSFRSVYIDRDDIKWLLGDAGIYRLGPESELLRLNESFPELSETVYAIREDTLHHEKYIATAGGVFTYSESDGKLVKVFGENCYSLFIDINDSIWISTRDGLYIAALEDLRTGRMPPDRMRRLNRCLGLSDKIVNEIYQDRYGSTWLISDSEILRVFSTSQKGIKYDNERGLRNNNILSFWVDYEDNIWIGFSGGLQRLTNKRGLRNFYPGIINSYIYSIFQDRYSRIWIASYNGLYYYSGNQLVHFSPRLSRETENFCATLLPTGNILAASTEGLFEIDANNLNVVRQRKWKDFMFNLENIMVTGKEKIYLLTGMKGVVYYLDSFQAPVLHIENKKTSNIYQLIDLNGVIFGGNRDEIIIISEGTSSVVEKIGYNIWSMCEFDNVLWMGTDNGIYKFEGGVFTWFDLEIPGSNQVIKSILPAKNRNCLWLGTNNGFSYFNTTTSDIEFTIDSKDGLPGDEITTGGLFIDENDLLWIGTYHGLSTFNLRAMSAHSFTPLCYIEEILLNGDPINKESGKIFRYFENNLVFEISALSYSDEKSIEYEFYLRGVGNDYSSYNKGPEYKAYFNNLPAGKYEFIYKAKGKNNIWGYAQKYEFTVKKAWYHTWLFRILTIVLVSFGAWSFYKIRVRAIEAQKKLLERLVAERTHELEVANIEIEAQRDMATHQRDQISQQKKEIEDSINYAQRIQQSLLPTTDMLNQLLPEHFIIFKPRDVVSGDFYWATTYRSKLVITAADCTGHGVPGAFMSMLGIAFLNEIVNKQAEINASDILNRLRAQIIRELGQTGEEGENKDGMDMALCIIDLEKRQLEFAGANNPLYLIRNRELIETKGDKMPVAIHERMTPFSNHRISLLEGDALYMFSDGYPDQFGGPSGKKFMAKRFKELLIKISGKSMSEQGSLLEKAMDEWVGQYNQIDDMVIIGMRI